MASLAILAKIDIDPAQPAEPSVADIARSRGVSPVEVMIDLSLDSQFEQLFRQPISEISSELVLAGLRHPNTVVAASDSGAHISQILDSNIPTYFLSHWVREAGAFTWAEAIHMLTGVPARVWGLDRPGVLQAGAFADVVVFVRRPSPARSRPCSTIFLTAARACKGCAGRPPARR